MRTTMPAWLSRARRDENSFAALGSSPDVGSSSSSALASLASAIAMPTFCPHALRVCPDAPVRRLRLQPYLCQELQKVGARVVGASGKRTEILPVLKTAEILVQHHGLGDVGEISLGLEWPLSHVDAVDPTSPRLE
jgi:hypothetical protein